MRTWKIAVAVSLLLAFAAAPRAGWAQGGVPIGPEFRVNTYTTSSQAAPSVAADPEARFVVVWFSNGQEGGFGVFGQRYFITGLPMGPEFRVNTYTTGDQYDPSAAMWGAGNFVVVWTSTQDGSYAGIFGQRFLSSGAPAGPEFLVNTYTTAHQYQAAAAADLFGNFVVAWTSAGQDGLGAGVFGQRYAAGSGVPIGPEFRVNTYTTGDQYRPAVAAAPGGFVVVWQDGTVGGGGGAGRGVFGQRYDSSGAPLGAEFQVETYTTGFQGFPSVSADASGDFVVVWHSDGQDGSDLGVFGQRYSSAGSPLGPEFRVNTYTTGFQGSPAVTVDGAGNFAVVWHGADGSGSGVFGQRYASSGVPLGSEFRVNTHTTDNQASASVASIGGGTFVVAWQSSGQDGYAYGVFSQRYSAIVPVELVRFGVE
jgi:hypothetical protein